MDWRDWAGVLALLVYVIGVIWFASRQSDGDPLRGLFGEDDEG